jgi:hypothetical protein
MSAVHKDAADGGQIVSLHKAQLRIAELEGELKNMKKPSSGFVRFLKVSAVLVAGFSAGIWLGFDLNWRLKHSHPFYGFVCRSNGLEPVIKESGKFGDRGKVVCADLSGAVDERDLFYEMKARILGKDEW